MNDLVNAADANKPLCDTLGWTQLRTNQSTATSFAANRTRVMGELHITTFSSFQYSNVWCKINTTLPQNSC